MRVPFHVRNVWFFMCEPSVVQTGVTGTAICDIENYGLVSVLLIRCDDGNVELSFCAKFPEMAIPAPLRDADIRNEIDARVTKQLEEMQERVRAGGPPNNYELLGVRITVHEEMTALPAIFGYADCDFAGAPGPIVLSLMRGTKGQLIIGRITSLQDFVIPPPLFSDGTRAQVQSAIVAELRKMGIEP